MTNSIYFRISHTDDITPDFKARAVLFDMDGVLAINAHFHDQAWRRFARERLSLELVEGDVRIHHGRNTEVLTALTGSTPDRKKLLDCDTVKEECYRNLARGNLQPVRGLVAYLDWLTAHGIPFALVTSSNTTNVDFMLGELGLANRFPIRVTAEDVRQGKPDPEPYLLGASLIGVDPAFCIVHEDSPAGVQSASVAGCTVVALTTMLAAPMLEAVGARLCVSDFSVWMKRIGLTRSE